MNNPIIFILLFFLAVNFINSRQLPFFVCKLLEEPLVAISIIIGVIIGIVIHEFSHAFVAYRLGDPTAKLEGRLTLNPQAHLDPFGTLLLVFFGFGWGKPTPFDPFNLRNIKRDSALISVAGAVSNFLFAIVLSIPYLIAYYLNIHSGAISLIYYYISGIIFFNVLLGVFNLIPIHPLDGFKVLAGVLPKDWYHDFMQTERYGIFLLLILFVTPALGIILQIASILFSTLMPNFIAPLACSN